MHHTTGRVMGEGVQRVSVLLYHISVVCIMWIHVQVTIHGSGVYTLVL